jgi:DNA-binding NtrC family response regulator
MHDAQTTASQKVRILFVDDEAMILTAIERQLRKDRSRWEMVFAVGGQRALDEIQRSCFTVVVSDFRMPQIDGVAVLNQARASCPTTVQIMLSGDAEAPAMSRAVPDLHRLIRKPCDGVTLRQAIEHAIDHAIDAAGTCG